MSVSTDHRRRVFGGHTSIVRRVAVVRATAEAGITRRERWLYRHEQLDSVWTLPKPRRRNAATVVRMTTTEILLRYVTL